MALGYYSDSMKLRSNLVLRVKHRKVRNCELFTLSTILYNFSHRASQSMKWGSFKCCPKEESNLTLSNSYKKVLNKYTLLIKISSSDSLLFMCVSINQLHQHCLQHLRNTDSLVSSQSCDIRSCYLKKLYAPQGHIKTF